ncbi:MAG TPA: TraM recognition domain-containing protein [Dermatophilaceae bacterium]
MYHCHCGGLRPHQRGRRRPAPSGGEHEAAAIWDAASIKLILGGGSNAGDLEDLSKLIGQRAERQCTQSFGPDGPQTLLRELSYAGANLFETFIHAITHKANIVCTPSVRDLEHTLPQGEHRDIEPHN